MASITCKSLVVKIGGSAITDKTKSYTIKHDVLVRVAEAIARAYADNKKVIVVHGGGSFGHYEVDVIRRQKGVLDHTDSGRIQLAMLRLALEVIKKFVDKNVPAVLHPPHTYCKGGDIKVCDFTPILRDLELGLIPVTYGDAIPEEDGVAILSGDDLAAALAHISHADCLIYVIDKAGVMSEEGERIPIVTQKDIEVIGKPKGFDVTGGMAKKLRVALEASRESETTVVITDVDGLEMIIKGKRPGEVGTLVKG
ncbi:MAG: hypothetical protein F7C35_01385 [Desulfurococcales archaeon]|nr:hypothetical protein [Desulfurococcales archaeon]